MKKAISLLLTAIIIAGCLTCGAYADETNNDIKIAVASDLHYNIPREELAGPDNGVIDDEIYFYANRRACMEDESGFIIDEFLNQCAEDDSIQYVLIPGDMADNGRRIIQEHYDVAAKLKKFEEETGKPIYICNGNHDSCTTENETTNEQFREIYYEFGYNEAIDTLEGTLSYTANLGDKYRLIVGDSCDPGDSTEDGLTSDRVNWICEMAEKAYSEGRYPILMMHHNLLEHMPLQRIVSHNFIVRNHSLTAEKLANAGIKVVLTGHEHGSDVISYTSTTGNVITDFSTTSLTMYPLEYRVMTFTDDTVTYESKSIDKIDTDALSATCNGYTQEMLDLMNEDLNAYALGYFKAGIKFRLSLSLSMEKMGIDEDAIYYDLVYTAVNGLTSILEMPLYGEGSADELAKQYNIDLPASDYENGWDLVTDVLAYHYAGNEPFDLDSAEVNLVLKLVDLILLDALSSTNDKVFLAGANKLLSVFGTESICKDLTKAATNIFGPVTAGEYFLVALASPLLYGLAYDRDDLDDNNGSIEGYGVTADNFQNVTNNVTGFFKKIGLYFSFFFTYILKIFKINIK